MASKPITTRINDQLRKAGMTERFVRGHGYYYVTGVAVNSALYICWLDNDTDYEIARDHVNEVLRNEHSHFTEVRRLAKLFQLS